MHILSMALLLFLTMIAAGALALPLVMNVPGPKFGDAYPTRRDSPAKARIGLVVLWLFAFAVAVILAHSLATGVAPCPVRRCDAEFQRGSSAVYWPVLCVFYAIGVLFSSVAWSWVRYLRNRSRA